MLNLFSFKKNIFIFISFSFISSLHAFDHSHRNFDSILKKYVTNGRVAYKELANDGSLKIYLDSLSSVKTSDYTSFSRTEKLAFLINAYNAFTLQLILDNYPLKSIRNIGILPGAAWKKKFFILLEEERNLDWIEHEKLRKDFDEPRIHFTIVCASIGCPILANSAYTSEKLDFQLRSAYEQFLNDPNKNRYDESSGTLYLSSIFDWFKSDFARNGSIVDFVHPAFKAKIPKDCKIKYTYYDWNLNEKH